MGEQSQSLSSSDGREHASGDDVLQRTDTTSYNSRRNSVSSNGLRPPLSPRPNTLVLLDENPRPVGTIRKAAPLNLQGRATTAVSLADVGSQQLRDSGKDVYATHSPLPTSLRAQASLSQLASPRGSETGDSASIKSSAPNIEADDTENIFGDFSVDSSSILQEHPGALLIQEYTKHDVDDDFLDEFEPIGEDEGGENEEMLIRKWMMKRKHYIIFSAAGKPIWTRHGDGSLISTYIGVIQTIISFYEQSGEHLTSFSAGNTKFVVMTRGPLHLVAISRLLESEDQLRLQLDALYMQILSTLTLPSLDRLFSARPSTDLKRPLEGSQTLLSTLADSFIKGSPSTLLSALECLKIRKSHRQIINSALLKNRANNLLYGLVAAGGRLVSVVRPRKHSLHPGDLQILFNMIFEAEGVKAGGGESWIPVCLPGFNSNGYLYMYVDFLDLHGQSDSSAGVSIEEDSVAIILISADKESFFEMQTMRNALVKQMEKDNSIDIMRNAIVKGRPGTIDILPGTVLRHFLYKSRANVQFTMSSYGPDFSSVTQRRGLISMYSNLHASVHAKHAYVKIHHCISKYSSAFAWVTPVFELYCVARPNANRNALAQSASQIVRWVQREKERLFIIGGAVF